jgi:hypothetical protein
MLDSDPNPDPEPEFITVPPSQKVAAPAVSQQRFRGFLYYLFGGEGVATVEQVRAYHQT